MLFSTPSGSEESSDKEVSDSEYWMEVDCQRAPVKNDW